MATTYTHTSFDDGRVVIRGMFSAGWHDDIGTGGGRRGDEVVEGGIEEEGEGGEFLYKIHTHRLLNFIRKHIKVIIFIKLVTGGYTPHTHTSV